MTLKILLTGWGFPPKIDGGLDIHVYHLFQELQKMEDVEVTLALPEENRPERDGVVGVETGEGDMKWKSRKLSAEVAKIAEEYDVIHTHDWFGAEAGYKAANYAETSWVSTVHSLISARTRGTSEEIGKMEEVAVKEPEALISVSEGLQKNIEQEFGRSPEVIYNGFSKPSSTGKEVKKSLGIEGDMIFFVGRHAEQKGIEHLLYGFKKYLEQGGEASLVIGGDGHMRPALENFAKLLGIEDKTYFTGFIPSEELGDYYREAEAFVSPSINEPFGLTITEALESGTPVLATESGVKELVSTGAITEIEPSSDSIADGLKEALEKDLTPEFDSRSWKEMAEEYLDVYRNL